jgi:hypothetical protein
MYQTNMSDANLLTVADLYSFSANVRICVIFHSQSLFLFFSIAQQSSRFGEYDY